MDTKVNMGRFLAVSDSLKDRFPTDLDDANEVGTVPVVTIVINVAVGDKRTAVVGILRSVLVEAEPELDVKVPLDDALSLVQSMDSLVIERFEVHSNERVVKKDGPYVAKGIRIDEVNATDGMCLMSLGMKRMVASTLKS